MLSRCCNNKERLSQPPPCSVVLPPEATLIGTKILLKSDCKNYTCHIFDQNIFILVY